MNAPLIVPQQIKLTIAPAAYELIRGLLGKQAHDQVNPLIGELEAQVNQQIVEHNVTKTAEAPARDEDAWAESGVEKSCR